MVSEKKAEANRKNAQKSTGPKSSEGKARSSRNALTHGLTAEVHVPVTGDEAYAYNATLELWLDDMAPTDLAQRAMVERACRASWKLERCARFEDAEAAHRARHAATNFTLEQQNRALLLELT